MTFSPGNVVIVDYPVPFLRISARGEVFVFWSKGLFVVESDNAGLLTVREFDGRQTYETTLYRSHFHLLSPLEQLALAAEE